MNKAHRSALQLVGHATPTTAARARAALTQIYCSSRKQLVRFLVLQTGNAAEAEDIAQAAYLKLASRAEGLVETNLRSLLFITARNIALDLRRQKNRKRRVIDDPVSDNEMLGQVASLAPDVERWLIAREHVGIIGNLISELPPKCRKAFIAYKLDEREYREIAAEMGVSESMVRKYVIRAVSHCAKRFEELEGWE